MRSGSKISAVAIAAVLLLTGCNNGIPTPESENVTRVADSTVVEAATTDADDLSVASSITTSDSSVTDNTDIFEQITDTSMPDPGISSMYGTYLDFSSPWKQRVSHVLLPLYSEQKERGSKWVKSKESVPTPYNLYNSMSLVSFCRDLDIPWESIEDNVRAWNGSVRYPAGTPREEYEDIERFTEEELAALKTGDDETIVKLLASDYSIVVGENVFSPMWLYYHTVDDYKTAGIAPNTMYLLLEKYSKFDLTEETSNAIHSPLERYSKFDLTEEAWRAFRKKLILYAYSETCPDKDRIYTYETDISEPLGDDAFRIFEEFFYGEWECISNYENSVPTFDMTYNGSSFRFGRILGVFETDEIYVLHYNSGGGTLECYVIEKSAPETMYSTDVLPSLGGIEEIKLGNDEPMKYVNRKPAAAKLKTGILSIPGLTYLFHIYGSDFEDYYREIIDRDGYQSIREDEELYLGNRYVLDSFIQYLVDTSKDSVTIALPYVHDKQESHQTAVYYELTFTKDANGEWSVEYAKSETYTAGYSFNGVEIPDELITEDGENYIRASASFVVSPKDGALFLVKSGDKLNGLVVEECSSTFFKNEDNTLTFGDQRVILSGETKVSGTIHIYADQIDDYWKNGAIYFIPVDESFPVFFSDHYAEKKVGNELYIGSIFKSSGLYVGDEFADALKNCNGKHITVTLKDIEISMAVNETDNSKATLMAIEGM